jgi:hypothetical protein
MNDLEARIRQVLDEDATRAPHAERLPKGLVPRVRKRQARTGVGATIVAALVIVLGAVGMRALLPDRVFLPAVEGSSRTSTVDAVTITYPASWYLTKLDQVTSTQDPGPDGGPSFAFRPLLELTNFDPTSGTSWICPLPSGRIPDGGVVLYVQVVNRTIDAGQPGRWPVEPSKEVLAETYSGLCPVGAHAAAWTADGVTYEAFLRGAGPDFERLVEAFRSMSFAGGTPVTAGSIQRQLDWSNVDGSIVATGSASSVDWRVATDEPGFTLTLGEREENFAWGDFGWYSVRPLHTDSNYDALAFVLTDLDVDRVCVSSEGSWCGRWMPARDAPGREARLWVIELPGAGTGILTLNDRGPIPISWP